MHEWLRLYGCCRYLIRSFQVLRHECQCLAKKKTMNVKEPKLFYGDPRPNQKRCTFHVNKMGTGHDQILDQKRHF